MCNFFQDTFSIIEKKMIYIYIYILLGIYGFQQHEADGDAMLMFG